MSILASEALVESREYEILDAEEVESLKKEQALISARLVATSKKLGLETKIRDAAVSLSKVNAGYRNASKQTAEQLAAAERKVEVAQQEYYRTAERAGDVNRRLLEHQAAVLSFSVHSLEKQLVSNGGVSSEVGAADGGHGRESSIGSIPTIPSDIGSQKFDGAHLFAGHPNAVSPSVPRAPPTEAEIAALEARLKEATTALSAATQKQAEMGRELTMMRLEKEQLETSMSMDLQGAEDRISELQNELSALRQDTTQARELDGVQEQLVSRDAEIAELRKRLERAEASNAELIAARAQSNSEENAQLKETLSAERAVWDLERVDLEGRLHQVEDELHLLRQSQAASEDSNAEIQSTFTLLRDTMQRHEIVPTTPDSSLLALAKSVDAHVEMLSTKLKASIQAEQDWEMARKRLQDDIQIGLDKREALVRDLEEARKEREDARKEARVAEAALRDQPPPNVMSPNSTVRALVADMEIPTDIAKVIATLQPIWAILPSPEARATKMASRSYRADRPNSPGTPTSNPSSPRVKASLSEMDVRSLKTLYDPNANPQRETSANSFSIENFAQRVQALIADDRALIERLIRFAQAHDLLKKNAERAQKLAQESNAALETYQKQVKMLEERNAGLGRSSDNDTEVQLLQAMVERLQQQKLEIEQRAADQAETTRQLSETNERLSARALTLATEAANVEDGVRRQMEAQLTELKSALAGAQEEASVLQERNMTMMLKQAEMEEELQGLRRRK